MYVKIFIVIPLLCTTAVFCRSNLDVLNDFEPIFQERHNEFRKIKISFEIETMPYFDSFDNKKLEVKNDLIDILRDADEEVDEETTKYLEDRGIIRPEKIIHCMNRLKINRDNVQSFAKGGERVCDQLAHKNITEIKEYYNDKGKKIENEHNIIELTRGACIKLRVPYDVQTCIIHDLYTFYLPHIAEVKKAMQIYTQEIGNEVKNGINQNEACFNIVKENAKLDAKKAISDFKVCAWMTM